jgi:hypothetical protein|tara:strand:+ start:76 stop:318 length:243 start_codon:yes stop_codon:yes gene_type:complete
MKDHPGSEVIWVAAQSTVAAETHTDGIFRVMPNRIVASAKIVRAVERLAVLWIFFQTNDAGPIAGLSNAFRKPSIGGRNF